MANELSKYETGLVSKAAESGLGELLKPLQQEIHLFDSYVAGTSHIPEPAVLDEIKEGDMLFLIREDNKFDSNAIMIMSKDKKKVGYVPEKDKLSAKITKIEKKGSFTKIAVSIYLVDF